MKFVYHTLSLVALVVVMLLILAAMGYAQTSTSPTQPINLTATPVPVWFNATPERSDIRLLLPAGTVFRFGDTINNKWSVSTIVKGMNVTPSTTGSNGAVASPYQLIPYYANMPFPDPDQGTLKELDILEQAWVQTINAIDAMGKPYTVIVPQLPIAPPPPVNPLGMLVGTCYVSKSSSGNFVMTCTPSAT